MNTKLISTILFLGGTTWMVAQTSSPINPACEKLFPVAFIEKISGQKNLVLIPYDPMKGAGGTCNYAIGGKTMILLVTLDQWASAKAFEQYKSSGMYQTNQKMIPKLGDEAFSCGEKGTILVARKDKTLIVLSAFSRIEPTTGRIGGTYFTREQLTEIASNAFSK